LELVSVGKAYFVGGEVSHTLLISIEYQADSRIVIKDVMVDIKGVRIEALIQTGPLIPIIDADSCEFRATGKCRV